MDPHSRCYLMMTLFLCATPSLKAADKAGDAAYEAAAGLFNLGLWKQASESYKNTLPNTAPSSGRTWPLWAGLVLLQSQRLCRCRQGGSGCKGEGPSKVESNLYLGQSLLLLNPFGTQTCRGGIHDSLQALGFERTGIINRTWDRKSIDAWLKKNTDKKQQAFAADVFVGLLESSYLQNDWKSVVNKVNAFEGLVAGAPIEQRPGVDGEAGLNLKDYESAAKAYEAGRGLEGT